MRLLILIKPLLLQYPGICLRESEILQLRDMLCMMAIGAEPGVGTCAEEVKGLLLHIGAIAAGEGEEVALEFDAHIPEAIQLLVVAEKEGVALHMRQDGAVSLELHLEEGLLGLGGLGQEGKFDQDLVAGDG